MPLTSNDWVFLIEAKKVYLCGSYDDTYYGPFSEVENAATCLKTHFEFDNRCHQIVVVRSNEVHHHDPVHPDKLES